MRVLVVTPWFPSAKMPGSGLFNLRDAELIANSGNEVSVLHLIDPDHMQAGEPAVSTVAGGRITVTRLAFRTSKPGTLRRAQREIRRRARGAELVHTMAMPALLPVFLARTGRPWVHTEHYSQLVTPQLSSRADASLRLLSRLFKYPTETVAVSGALASVIDRFRRRATTVIGNEVMAPAAALPSAAEPGEGPRLIGVGGIIERKGPLEAVGTLAELVRRDVDARLVWVGEGPLREKMLERAERLGVEDRVRLTGQLAPDDLSRELLAADIFLLPVETETFGVAIAEAMTHGLPVVVTGTGGHEEFIAPDASRLVPAREPVPLADAVEDLLGDPRRPTRGEIAERAASLFSDAHRRDEYQRVYASATESQR